MPSQRKRIGFLPSEEVHEIIDKLCRANELSQSKVTGLLVEEALRSRGVLSELFSSNTSNSYDFYRLNKELFIDDMKMMHEFIEFKYFKKFMRKNKDFFD